MGCSVTQLGLAFRGHLVLTWGVAGCARFVGALATWLATPVVACACVVAMPPTGGWNWLIGLVCAVLAECRQLGRLISASIRD
jgi:hypothetical protein